MTRFYLPFKMEIFHEISFKFDQIFRFSNACVEVLYMVISQPRTDMNLLFLKPLLRFHYAS